MPQIQINFTGGCGGGGCNTGFYVSTPEERAVEVRLGNLRKRLGDSSRSPRWVETVRGVGYRLAP